MIGEIMAWISDVSSIIDPPMIDKQNVIQY